VVVEAEAAQVLLRNPASPVVAVEAAQVIQSNSYPIALLLAEEEVVQE
jgi:hypothetical protein